MGIDGFNFEHHVTQYSDGEDGGSHPRPGNQQGAGGGDGPSGGSNSPSGHIPPTGLTPAGGNPHGPQTSTYTHLGEPGGSSHIPVPTLTVRKKGPDRGLDPGPVGKGSAEPGPISRGALAAIIVVCLIGLAGGGMALVPRLFPSAGTLFNPGVIAWEGLGGDAGAGAADSQRRPDVKTLCKKTSSTDRAEKDKLDRSLEEHLIGGGFEVQSGADPSVAVPDNSASQWDWRLHLAGGKWTSYAICLREPPAFFSPADALDYVAGPVAHFGSGSDAFAIASEASCPPGASILGGGYYALGAGTAGGQGDSSSLAVNSSYPIVDGSGARWHVSVDQFPHSSSATLQAFAICSGTMKTHVEHTAMTVKAVESPGASQHRFAGDGAASCASGTLLSGGFDVTQGNDDSGLEVGTQTNAPGKSLTGNKTTGDTFTDWTVTLGGTSKLVGATGVMGETWVVCWDGASSPTPTSVTGQPTATTAGTPTATPRSQPTNTPTGQPTATPRPNPTNTPPPQCRPFVSGSGSMDPNNFYLNVDSATGIGHDPSPAQVQWALASGAMSPINGALLADLGAIGASGFNNLPCARLKGASYGGGSAPNVVGEVFLVKTPGGHLAKVLITSILPADGAPTLQWQTYKP